MATDMKKFLYDYFALLNMQKMSDTVLSRLNEFIKKDDYPNDDIKKWKDKFLEPVDPSKPNDAQKAKEQLPDINDLIDGSDTFEFDELFRALCEVFSNMNRNRANYDNDKITGFIDEYFGPTKLFEYEPIKPDTKDEIKKLIRALLRQPKLRSAARATPDQIRTITKIHNDINKIDNPDAKNTIEVLIGNIENQLYYGNNSSIVQQILQSENIDLDKITNGLKQGIIINKDKRDKFKSQYSKIFDTLYSKKAIYDAFKENDRDQTISRQIDNALKFTDYTGKINEDNYIAPKYKDSRKNPAQWIDSKLKETYEDVFKKYVSLHRDHIFKEKNAQAIIKAFDKAGIKPTDGLNTVIEKSGDIIGKLKGKEPFKASKHLEWLVGKLKLYKDNGLSDEIEGCLRWGYQMNRIITQIIKEAVPKGETEQAKTALEVLSVMQYGTFTSRRLNGLNEATKGMSILSDKNLSWNKNEGINFVTGLMDKTAGFMLRGAGLMATGLVNTARKAGTRFNNSGDIKKLSDKRKAKLQQNKVKAETDKNDADRNDDDVIRDNKLIANRVTDYISKKYNNMNIDGARQWIEDHEQKMLNQQKNIQVIQNRMEELQNKKDKYAYDLQQLQEVKEEYDRLEKIKTGQDIKEEIDTLQQQKQKIEKKINDINTVLKTLNSQQLLNSNGNPTSDPAAQQAYKDNLYNDLGQLYNEARKLDAQIKDTEALKNDQQRKDNARNEQARLQYNGKAYDDKAYGILKQNYEDTERLYNQEQQNFDSAQETYNNLSNDGKYTDLNTNMTQYSNAIENKEKAENDKRTRQEEWDKWDEKNRNDYEYLMAYWDFLQTGNTKNLFRLSTKKLQNEMNAKSKQDPTKTNMDMKMIAWANRHSYDLAA